MTVPPPATLICIKGLGADGRSPQERDARLRLPAGGKIPDRAAVRLKGHSVSLCFVSLPLRHRLRDALRRSVAQEKQAPARPKRGRKRIEGQTEMLLPIAGKKGKEAAPKPAAKPTTARQKKIRLDP